MADKTQYYELEKTNPIKPTNLNTQIDSNLVKIDSVMHENSVKAEGKQDKLVSGTNIKTINSQSILGSGDIVITGGSAVWGGITGTLANQTDLQGALDGKQESLNTAQMNAVNSGITPNKVEQYDEYRTSKQDALPTAVKDKFLHTNASTGALEWANAGSGPGSANWGSIGGTIADQTDLMDEFAKKENGLVAGENITLDRTTTPGKTIIKSTGGPGTVYYAPTVDGTAYQYTTKKSDGTIGWESPDVSPISGSAKLISSDAVYDAISEESTRAKTKEVELAAGLIEKQDKLPTAVAGKYLHSNADTGAMEWTTVSSAGAAWGSITGNLANQTDLKNALAGKAEIDDTKTSATDKTYSIDKIIELINTYGATFRGSFPTKADLDAYTGPMDENDTAIVQQDETHDQFATVYRYISEVWTFQYAIKVAFTTSQWDAINSGVTKGWKSQIEKAIDDEITRAKWEEAKKIELLGTEPGSGEEYHFPFNIRPLIQNTDAIVGKFDTITLDNHKDVRTYDITLPSADIDNDKAGLYTKTLARKKLDRTATDETMKSVIDNSGASISTTILDNDADRTMVTQDAESVWAYINDGTDTSRVIVNKDGAYFQKNGETEAIPQPGQALVRQDALDLKSDKTYVDTELAKKTTSVLNDTNGKALVFNEKDGGGMKFEHTDGTNSFVGVNDGGASGIAGQLYVLDSTDATQGCKINLEKGMFTYIKNKATADRTADDEIAVKGDVKASEVEISGATYMKSLKINGVDWNIQTGGSGTAEWGAITGSISEQSDLQTALGLRQKMISFGDAEPTGGDAGDVYLYDGANGKALWQNRDGTWTKALDPISVIDDSSEGSMTSTWSSNVLKARFQALAGGTKVEIVATRPDEGVLDTMYYVGTANPYHVWLCANNSESVKTWFDMGETTVALDNYYTKSEVYNKTETDTALNNKQSKITYGENEPTGGQNGDVYFRKGSVLDLIVAKQNKVTYGTGNPSGGEDGDLYIKYTA